MKHNTFSLRAGGGFALAFIVLALATLSHATVTNVVWYRLGENDPGAASGQIVNSTTIDFVGGKNLRRFGSQRYTNAVLSAAANDAGSSLAVIFNGSGQFYSNAVVTTARNNFGIEAWVVPAPTPGTYAIAFNGSWGLGVEVTSILGFTSARFFAQSGNGTVGLGTTKGGAHVALIRDNGTATLYVNGVASGTTNATPATPAGGFFIGASPLAAGFFPGIIDEVRVFTFSPGQFSTDDLLVNQRRANTLAASDFAPGSATLNGSVSSYTFATTAWFEWGASAASLDHVTAPHALGSSFTTTNFSEVLTGLSAGVAYYFRAVATNDLGLAFGTVQSFLIGPSVETLSAANFGPSTAKLNGTVIPNGTNTTAWFEWGNTTSYGNLTTATNVGADFNLVDLSARIAGLQPGQIYHFRCVATNYFGRADGADQSFELPPYPGRAGLPPLRSSYYNPTLLNWVAFDARPEWDSAVPMTIEAWVYRLDATRFETILSHDWPGSYWLGFAPRLRFYRGTNFAEVPTPVLAYKWTHVAVSYDGAVARFYINGELAGTRALSNTGGGKVRTLRVGHNGGNPNDFSPNTVFTGNLDEIRLWSVARSEEEIRDGLYREVRGEPGLAAVFPQGGRIEEISGLAGDGALPAEQIFGMMPRDLVVPRAAFPPTADGNINLATEYLGADQLVVRYPDQPDMPDIRAFFVHTDDDLFVAIAPASKLPNNFNVTNSFLSLFIDTSNARPALAESPQIELLARLDGTTNETTLLNGDGAGNFYLCLTAPGIGTPQPCTPRSLWQIGEQFCGGEIYPDVCTEFRVSRTLLGSFNEFDGVAIGQVNFTDVGDETFIPEDGFAASPATWLTMSYGDGSATLPRVRWNGRVFNGFNTNTATIQTGYRVSLISGSVGYSAFTDFFGRYRFDVPMPTGEVMFAQAELEAFGRYTLPRVYPTGLQPEFIFTNRVLFPGLPAGVTGIVDLASVDFFVQRPLAASAIVSAMPTNPAVGMAVRQGGIGGTGEVVTIYGTNLHAEMEFYLAPVSESFPVTPEKWTLLPAQVVARDPFGNWVQVHGPLVPEFVREWTNGVFIPSFSSSWRWVAHDSWFRPGRIEYSYTGPIMLQRPPYPNLYGFHFKNDQTFPGLEEFLAAYGTSAYICVGGLGECATYVPDPLYWILWYPVHFIIIAKSGGSCVGMAGTAAELYNNLLTPEVYDPDALFANGINDHNLPGDWDTSNTGGLYTRPPIPKDAWARIRMNHGAQTSAEYLNHIVSQLDVGVFSPHFGGNPVARLPELRAGTTAQAVCMVQGFDGGHCVSPYEVEDNFGGDSNKTRIWIYDNNNPCAIGAAADDACVTNQFIDIDLSANQYSFPDQSWTGTALFTVPLSLYTGEHTAPGLVDFAQALATFLVVVAGGADAHYSASNSEWGWRQDGTFVNNMPGLRAVPILGSPTNSTRSIPVLLPHSNGIPAIDINMRDNTPNIFHVAAGGTMLQLEMGAGVAGHSNQIRLGVHSNQLASFSFRPDITHSNFIPRAGFVHSNGACAAFQWMGLSAEAGRMQEFRADKQRRSVGYCNLTSKPTEHYLRIDAVDSAHSNYTCAVFGPFSVPTGAVHSVVLSDWPSVRQVRSELDLDGDGIPDQVTMVTGTSVDSDGDGMPDDWEIMHKLNPASALCDDGPDADPDHDGVSNYGEYLSGTDPHDPNSVLRLTATVISGNDVRLSWHAVPGRRYEILFTDDLEHIFRPISGAGFPRVATLDEESFDDTLPVAGVRTRFYQVRLVP